MSGIVNSFARAADRIGGNTFGYQIGSYTKRKSPLPGIPTIDEAKQQRQESDRLSRRRGALANLFGGQSESSLAPSVAVKQLLGQ